MIVFSCLSLHMSLTFGLKFSMLAACIPVCFSQNGSTVSNNEINKKRIMHLWKLCIYEKEILRRTFLEKLAVLSYLEIQQKSGFCFLIFQCYWQILVKHCLSHLLYPDETDAVTTSIKSPWGGTWFSCQSRVWTGLLTKIEAICWGHAYFISEGIFILDWEKNTNSVK